MKLGSKYLSFLTLLSSLYCLSSLSAATYYVAPLVDDPLPPPGTGTLRAAINDANAAGGGEILWSAPPPGGYDPVAWNIPPPVLAGDISINSNNLVGLILSDYSLIAYSGSITISSAQLIHSVSIGGMGGAAWNGYFENAPTGGGGGGLGAGGGLFVGAGATVTLVNVLVKNNRAIGGQGGTCVLDSGVYNIGHGGGGGGGAFFGSTASEGGRGGTGTTASATPLWCGGGGGGGGGGESGQMGFPGEEAAGLFLGGTGGEGGGGPSGGIPPGGQGGQGGTAINPNLLPVSLGQPGFPGLDPFCGGGGGGGGVGQFPPPRSLAGVGGVGGWGAGGGGGGGALSMMLNPLEAIGAGGGTGGFGGGGGGGGGSHTITSGTDVGGYAGPGGTGGFGGGGGGGGMNGAGSLFGGGVGGGGNLPGGGGGAGLGGGIFVEKGGNLNFNYSSGSDPYPISGNSVIGGAAGSTAIGGAGSALGLDIFMQSGSSLNFNLDSIAIVQLVSGIWSDNLDLGTSSITVRGNGALFMAPSNNFSAHLLVTDDATLGVSDDSGLGNLGATADIFVLDRGTLVGNNLGIVLSRNVYLGGGGGRISNSFGKITLNGQILPSPSAPHPTGAIRFLGSGNEPIILTGENGWLGPALVSGVELEIAIPRSLSTVPLSLDKGVLGFSSSFTGTVSNSITGTGDLLVHSGAQPTLAGLNTFEGVVRIAPGATLGIANVNSLTGTMSVYDEGSLQLGNFSGTLRMGSFTGPGNVIVDANGNSVSLTGSNSYTGGTYFKSGVLQFDSPLPYGSGPFVFQGGTLEILGSLPGTLDFPLFFDTQGTVQVDKSVTATGQVSGGGALICSGNGELILTGLGTDSGVVRIDSEATLTYASLSSLPVDTPLFFDEGLLQFLIPSASLVHGITGSGSVTIGGAIAYEAAQNYGGTTTILPGAMLTVHVPSSLPWGGNVVDDGALVFQLGSSTQADTVVGSIEGLGTFEIVEGTITLSGRNSYEGTTTIDPLGTLVASSFGALPPGGVVMDNGLLRFAFPSGVLTAGAIQGSGVVEVDGPGTVYLSDGDTYSGGSRFFGGVAQIDNMTSLGLGPLTFAGGTLEFLSSFTGTVGATLTFNPPGGVLQVDSGLTVSATGTFQGYGNVTLMGTGELVFSGIGGYTSSTIIGPQATLTLASLQSLAPSTSFLDSGLLQLAASPLTVTQSISGVGGVRILGNATYLGSKTYQGTTTINPGASLTIGATTAFPDNSAVWDSGVLIFSFPSPSNTKSLLGGIGGTGALLVQEGTVVLNGVNTYGGTTTINYLGTLEVGASAGLPSTSSVVDGGILLFQHTMGIATPGPISGTGSVVMNATGAFLSLTGTNTYGGGTFLNSGTVQVQGASALGASGLSFNGGTLEFLSPFSGEMSVPSYLQNGGGTFQLDLGENILYTAGISGPGPLNCSGVGTLGLSATNTYGGTTTIASLATLASFFPGALPGSSNVWDVGSLFLEGDFSGFSVPNSIGGVGSVKARSTLPQSWFSLTHPNNTYSGGTFIYTGTLLVNDVSTLGVGPVNLSQGGTLKLEGGDPLSLEIVVGSGGGVIDVENALLCSSSISSSSSAPLSIIGPAQFTFSGTSFSQGSTTIGGGTPTGGQVTLSGGSFQGPVIVSADGLLDGEGSVGPLTNGGTVSVASGQEISVQGDYFQNSSGLFDVFVSPDGSYGSLSVTQVAHLSGTLQVDAAAGVYPFGTRMTILASGAPLQGTFSSFIPSPVVPLTLFYEDSDVILWALSGSVLDGAFVYGYNPQQVLANLQQDLRTPSIDLVSVIEAMEGFNSEQLTEALDQLHPAAFGAFDLLSKDTNAFLTSILSRHSSQSCQWHLRSKSQTEKSSIWLNPFGYLYDQDRVGEQLAFHSTMEGIEGGWNFCAVKHTLFGIGAAYSLNHVNWHPDRGEGSLEKTSLSLYANYLKGNFSGHASLMGGLDILEASRLIHFSTIHRRAHHRSRGYDGTAHLGASQDIDVGALFLRPFVNEDYTHLYQKAFFEEGARSLNLSVQGHHSHLLRSEVGLAASSRFRMGRKGCFSPSVWVSGINESFLKKNHFTSTFSGETIPFVVRAFSHSINFISPGAECSFLLDCGLSAAVRYSAELARKSTIQKADLRFEWFF